MRLPPLEALITAWMGSQAATSERVAARQNVGFGGPAVPCEAGAVGEGAEGAEGRLQASNQQHGPNSIPSHRRMELLNWKAGRARAAAPCSMPLYSTVLLRLIRSVGLNAQPVERLISRPTRPPFCPWPVAGPRTVVAEYLFLSSWPSFFFCQRWSGPGGDRVQIHEITQYIELPSCLLRRRHPPPEQPKGSVANPGPQQADKLSAKCEIPSSHPHFSAANHLSVGPAFNGQGLKPKKRPPRSSR